MGVSSVCVEEGERRSEEEVGRSLGRSVGRSAGAAPKVRTPHKDVGNKGQGFYTNYTICKVWSHYKEERWHVRH